MQFSTANNDSTLHNAGDANTNPFEIPADEDAISADPHMTIESDDVDLSSAHSHVSATPKSTTTVNSDAQSPPVVEINDQSDQSKHYASGTLDEPVSQTILRDLKNVAVKLQQVLHPKGNRDVLRDWDLWGPLILCLSLAILLGISARKDQEIMVFTSVFTIVWFGSAIVTINAKLLGGTVSFFQSVCVLGYCIFPLVIAAFIAIFVKKVYIRLPLVVLAFLWSSWASVNFLSSSHLSNRRLLAVYPLFLFYFAIGCWRKFFIYLVLFSLHTIY
ncbi:Yip1 domain-containing protein [Gigaspora rosea]|uniref:Protein YIP n=1 Tax=Gigaspora rosea TaxID=44941 RepID=A0A397UVP2_9GLOM|nr:Yip1 domain-containing protein [Gigaspora rosea]